MRPQLETQGDRSLVQPEEAHQLVGIPVILLAEIPVEILEEIPAVLLVGIPVVPLVGMKKRNQHQRRKRKKIYIYSDTV
jgi:hypothetical protein